MKERNEEDDVNCYCITGNGYWKLKEEALDRTLWRTRLVRINEPLVRQFTE